MCSRAINAACHAAPAACGACRCLKPGITVVLEWRSYVHGTLPATCVPFKPNAQAVNELPPDAKRARIQQLHLAATVRPGAASASYPGAPSLGVGVSG